jgi:cell division protein FtsI/penicillin-binding protein 2
MRTLFLFRIRIILAGIVIVALCIVTRLYFVQIVHGEAYAAKAERQFSSSGGGLFDRGKIFFTRKDGTLISAATLGSGFLVAINPQTLTDPESAYDALPKNEYLLSREAFLSAAEKKQQVYIEVAHRLTEEEGRALSEKNIPGVLVLRERWRQYPGGSLASQSIGIVSYGSGDALAGQTGLEANYENVLSRSGTALYRNFFAELFSNVGDLLVAAGDAREGDIITAIEPEVQTRLEDALQKLNQKYGSKESGGIIMIPSTGAIIALTTYPSFDGNDLTSVDAARLGNPLVEHVYEFGSIMKPLTMASALDAGVVTPSSTYTDTGCVVVSTARLCNWDQKSRGTVPMQEIITQSLNLGSVHLADELGQEKFRNYFMQLFGQKSGVDLSGESNALLTNLTKPQQVGYSTAAFGQGIAMTPFQMVRAAAALANGGAMPSPHLVRAVRLQSGILRTVEVPESEPVFSEKAVRAVATMMTAVVDEKLEQGRAKIPTMSVAAKTGTAQLTTPEGGYYTDRFFHSFVGFFPSYAPRFIILLYTNDPQGVTYASETLNTTFLGLVHFLIEYYAVPPDRGVASPSV